MNSCFFLVLDMYFCYPAIVFILGSTLIVISLLPLEILRSQYFVAPGTENVPTHLTKSAMGVFLVGSFASVLSLFLA